MGIAPRPGWVLGMILAVLTEQAPSAEAVHREGLETRCYKERADVNDVDGLNAGYARALFDEYLENPEAVPAEWRALFESGDSELVQTLPGLARLLEMLRERRQRRARTGDRAAGRGAGTATRARAGACAARRPGRRDAARRRGAPRWRSSRRTARTATSPPGSTRSAPSRSAIPALEPERSIRR